MSIAYLGIGSNIGNRRANCREAVNRLRTTGDVEVIKCSAFYETYPVGGPPQGNYLNGVVKVATEIPPERFLRMLKAIERDMGRRSAGRNHPRVIDIDILLYDDVVMATETLVIPHARMHERYFVLRGLAEIAPEAIHPILLKTVKELSREVERGRVSDAIK